MEQMLYNEYGIQVQSLQQIPAGWSASAWKVHSECGDYFLKVYDKHKPSQETGLRESTAICRSFCGYMRTQNFKRK